MKFSLVLCLALASWITPGLVSGAEPAVVKTTEEQTLELFQQQLKAKEWQMAEIVARGAVSKYGAESELAAKMRSQVERSAHGSFYVLQFFECLPLSADPDKTYLRTYRVVDLLKTPQGELPADAGERLSTLAAEIRNKCFEASEADEYAVQPFHTNLSLVVSASAAQHDQLIRLLHTKRETR